MNTFLPKMSSLDFSPAGKIVMCKPVRHVGMGIDNLVFNIPFAFTVLYILQE